VHPSYDAYKQLEVARDLKETLCRISDSTLMEKENRYCSIPLVPYELPDGTRVEVNIERYQMGELLIDPSTIDQLYNQDLETLYPQLPTSITVPGTLEGVPKIMSDAVARCDHDMQAMLLKDIVLTGGSSSIDGLQDRIRTELEKILYAGGLYCMGKLPLEDQLYGNPLGSFHELWVVDRKCP